MKNISLVFCLTWCLAGYSQAFNKESASSIIHYYLENEGTKCNVFLDASMKGSIFYNDFSKRSVYDSLKPYFSKRVVDSIDSLCSVYSKDITWSEHIDKVTILSSASIRLIFDSCERISESKPRREGYQRRKFTSNSKVGCANLYMKTSPPVFVRDYCLIYISTFSGNTSGSQCLYLFKLDRNKGWQILRKFNCRMA